MKKLLTIIGIIVLAGAVIFPVMALSHGWGYGHHMMRYWGNEPGYGRGYYGPDYGRGGYGNLTSEQQTKLNTLQDKYYNETKDLREKIWTKSGELDSIINSTNPDIDKAKALQNEISDLRAKLNEKTLNYEIEARKIAPDQQLGYGNGGWYDHHIGAYGHMMGYGPGYCWN